MPGIPTSIGRRGTAGGRAEESGPVLIGEPPLLANAMVPVLGEGFCHLYAESVQEQVVVVGVGGEQFGPTLRNAAPRGHDMERGVVHIGPVGGTEEVGNA